MANVMLKRDGICPGCDGRVIWHIEEKAASEGIRVASTGAWHSRRAVGRFELYVCKSCGLTEWYSLGIDTLAPDPERGIHLISSQPQAGLR